MSSRWSPFSSAAALDDPIELFERWYDEGAPLMSEPAAVALATASADGRPSVRMVLLRARGVDGYGWFTNYESRKGRELLENPHAALLWFCEPLGRQIRVEGSVAPMTAGESDAYFASRPRGHQIGALVSAQSRPLESRERLEHDVQAMAASLGDAAPTRPISWGGFRLRPTHFEFWQQRADRLHDRFVYDLDGATWRHQRLAP